VTVVDQIGARLVPNSDARRRCDFSTKLAQYRVDDKPFDYDLVCIGSGPAGQRGAVQAAKLGRRVALVERRSTLGEFASTLARSPVRRFAKPSSY